MALSPNNNNNNNNNNIYNYSYISHDSNGQQRSLEATLQLEAFYLLFNPTTTHPPSDIRINGNVVESPPATTTHLSSTMNINAPVVEPTPHLSSTTKHPDSPSGSPMTHLLSTKETDASVVEAVNVTPPYPVIDSPVESTTGLWSLQSSPFYCDTPHPSSTKTIDAPVVEDAGSPHPIDAPVIESMVTGPWNRQESGLFYSQENTTTKATGDLLYFDLADPPPTRSSTNKTQYMVNIHRNPQKNKTWTVEATRTLFYFDLAEPPPTTSQHSEYPLCYHRFRSQVAVLLFDITTHRTDMFEHFVVCCC